MATAEPFWPEFETGNENEAGAFDRGLSESVVMAHADGWHLLLLFQAAVLLLLLPFALLPLQRQLRLSAVLR